jgi:hypothetical protein
MRSRVGWDARAGAIRIEVAMIEFHKIWIEQCEAARGIAEEFGTEKAMGYLIGEKLLNFIRAANERPEFAKELPSFIAEIKRIFGSSEIRLYLDNLRRVGAPGHVCTDEQYEVLRDAGVLDGDVVRGAEDVIIVGRIREMLLGETAG